MPTPYVGGYFSSTVTSLLYPMEDLVRVGRPIAGSVDSSDFMQIPLDLTGKVATALVDIVELLVVLAATSYMNVEGGGKASSGALTSVDLITTIAFVTYTHPEGGGKASSGALTSVDLITTIAFVTYSNTEGAGKVSSAVLDAVDLL